MLMLLYSKPPFFDLAALNYFPALSLPALPWSTTPHLRPGKADVQVFWKEDGRQVLPLLKDVKTAPRSLLTIYRWCGRVAANAI